MDIVLRRTLRQFTGLFKQILINLLSEDGEVWEQEFKKFLRKEPCWVPPQFDLAEFFRILEGLRVWDEFTERILAPALKMAETTRASVGKPFNLPNSMTDADILKELGGNHVFEDARAFLVYLTSALKLQWRGTSGDLLSNGHANIFYVRGFNSKVFAVSVRWDADRRKWCVVTSRLDGGQWDAGHRAFPCNF